MLRYFEFNALSLVERANALWDDGELLIRTVHDNGRTAYYANSDYYVEVRTALAPGGPVEIIAFIDGPQLADLASRVALGP